MQRWKSLMRVVAALTLAACGETAANQEETDRKVDPAKAGDDTGTGSNDSLVLPDAGSGGGGGEGEGGDSFAECPRESIVPLPEYVGEAVWTLTDYTTCLDKCGSDDMCWSTDCPGSDQFTDCVTTQAFSCSGSSAGGCQLKYEQSVCCALAEECATTDAACIADKCGDYVADFIDCATEDTSCTAAVQRCLKPETATSMPTAAPRALEIRHVFERALADPAHLSRSFPPGF